MKWLLPILVAILLLTGGLRSAQAGSDGRLRWYTLKSDHFFIHYYEQEETLAREFLALAEEAYEFLTEEFEFEPSEKCHLVLVDDVDSANGLTLVVPYNHVVLYSYVPDAIDELGFWGDWKRIVIYHELVHIFHLDHVTGIYRIINYVLGKTFLPNGAVPDWFTEGLAVNVESRLGVGGRIGSPLYSSYLRLAVAEDALLQLDEITGTPLTLPRGTIPYLYGAYFMHWLAQRSGTDKLFEYVREQGGKLNPLSLNISARRIFGDTFVALYKEWQEALTRSMNGQITAILEDGGLREGAKLLFAGEYAPNPSFAPDGSLLWRSANGRRTQLLMKLTPDGEVIKLTHCRGGCDRPQQNAAGDIHFSVHQYHRTYYYFQDLYRFHPDQGRSQLTEGLRVKNPAISPNGRLAAFIRTSQGQSTLVVQSLEDGLLEALYSCPGGLAWPAWSPDGQAIAVQQQHNGNTDILLITRRTGTYENLTPGPSVEAQPTFSPDGRLLLFSSSRTGVLNLYALDLESRCSRQLTNVIGAAYSPTVHPDGTRVVYASYHNDGYYLYEVPLNGQECTAIDFSTPPPHPAPEGGPPVEYGQVLAAKPKRYNPFRFGYPRQWTPSFLTGSFDLTLVGLDVTGNDPVGHLFWSVASQLNTQNLDSSTSASVSINAWYPTISLFGGYYRNTFWAKPDDAYRDYRENDWYGSISLSFPFRRTGYYTALAMGYTFEHFTGSIIDDWEFDPGSTEPYFPLEGNLGSMYTSLSFDNTESYSYSVTTERGISAATELRLSSPLLGSNWTEYNIKWRLTGYLPMPWLNHHVLKGLVKGGWAGGRKAYMRKFSVGGYPDQDIIADLIEGVGMAGTFLRGFPPGAMRGRQYHFAALDYMFPLWRIRRGFQTWPVFFKDLYVDLFGNTAAAFKAFDFNEFLVGAGAELRLKVLLSYNLPFTLIAGAAYGFQQPGGFQYYFFLGQ